MTRLACLALFATALAGAAWADTPATGAASTGTPASSSTPPVTTAANTAPKNQLVCEWVEEIGSRLGRHKECHSVADKQRGTQDAQDSVNDAVRRATQFNPNGH